MKSIPHLLGAVLSATALGAHAQLDSLERFTGLQVAGYLEYQDYDFARSRQQSDGLSMHSADVGLLPLTLTLPPLELETYAMTASGQAHAEQTSAFSGSVLRYSARASAAMAGEALIGSAYGHASGRSNFMATFGVAADSKASLHMASLLDLPAASYSFRLVRQSDGKVIWDKTTLTGEDGLTLNDFTASFVLAAGYYELTTTLLAQAGIDPSLNSSASNAAASFELAVSAVPEPEALTTLLTGLAVVLAITSRRRRTPWKLLASSVKARLGRNAPTPPPPHA